MSTAERAGRRTRSVIKGVALLIFVVGGGMPQATAGEVPPLEPGKVVARSTKRGVPYAVYLPKKWNRKKPKPLPLVVFVPDSHAMPAESLAIEINLDMCDLWNLDEGGVIGCAILFQSHNKVRAGVEPEKVKKLPMFLDRDAGALDEVLAELRAEVPFQADAVGIYGHNYAAEVALGVGLRRPNVFTSVLMMNATGVGQGEMHHPDPTKTERFWLALPEGDQLEAALDLTILVPFHLAEGGLEGLRVRSDRTIEWLKWFGLRRVEDVGKVEPNVDPDPPFPRLGARFLALRDKARESAKRSAERDALLADAAKALEKDRLAKAVKAWIQAHALETEHELPDATSTVYQQLEARGLTLMKEAQAMSPARCKARLKKLIRTFKGTPFADVAEAALAEVGRGK